MTKQAERRIELERELWDAKAPEYDKLVNQFFQKTYQIVIENIIGDASSSKELLDAATGTGIVAIQLSPYVSRITAIDLSPQMLQVAKEKSNKLQIKNIGFKVRDICNLQFEDKTFDTVVASNVLHLLFEPQLALHEMHRVLMDKGRIIAPTFCHGANLRSKILSIILSLLGQKPKNWWSQKTFTQLVESSGFNITRQVYINDKIPLTYLVAIKR